MYLKLKKMAFTGKEGKVISEAEAKEIISKHTDKQSEIDKSGKGYTASEFYGIEAIKQLIAGVPVKSILGVKIHFGVAEKDGKEFPTTILELVTKDKTTQARYASYPPPCPTSCN